MKIDTIGDRREKLVRRLKKDLVFLKGEEKQQFDIILKHINDEKTYLRADFDKLAEFYNKYLK